MGRHWYTPRSYADAVDRLIGQHTVFGLGADHAAMARLADRIQQRLGELAMARNAEPPDLRCAVASLSARERGERSMLNSLRPIAPRHPKHVPKHVD